ncbi:MAG: phosphonate ABC transporter ATP-binding protein [Desulfobacterales bacterium]
MHPSSMELPAVEITNLSKTFGTNTALKRVSLTIGQGEMVALIGPSGSGKSTLLRHLSGLVSSDRHEKSIIKVMGKLVQRDGIVSGNIRMIRSDVGFIFQQFNLVGRLSLLTNILTGMLSRIPVWRSLFGVFLRREKMAAMEALRRVGIDNYAGQRASTLSGGQQQRGAIARALLQKAKLILADEPIASLDPQSATLVMEALRSLNREDLLTVVVSLHQIDFAFRYCPRSIALKDGQVIYDGPTRDLTVELLREVYGSDYLEIDRADGGRWNPSGGSESDGPQEPSRAMSAA